MSPRRSSPPPIETEEYPDADPAADVLARDSRDDRPRSARGREIAGVLAIVAGLMVAGSLAVVPLHWGVMGQFGGAVGGALHFLFGFVLAWTIPALLLWFGVDLLRGRAWAFPNHRWAGAALMIFSTAGLLALPGADQTEYQTLMLARSGLIGVFVVDYEGLCLVGQFGTAGAAIILCGVFLMGLALALPNGLIDLRWLRPRRRAPRVPAMAAPSTVGMVDNAFEDTPTPVDQPDDEAPAPFAPRRRATWRGLWPFASGRVASRIDSSPKAGGMLSRLELDEGWNEPIDRDVAEVARALEAHEWETQALRPAPTYAGETRIPPTRPAARTSPVVEEPAAAPASTNAPAAADPADEILFVDHTTSAKPTAAESTPPPPAPAPEVGKGLAKLFPKRWPAKADEEAADTDDAEELDDESEDEEAIDDAEADAGSEDKAHEEDPLFTRNYDTRPRGIQEPEAEEAAAQPRPDYRLPSLSILADPPQVEARMTREEMLEMSQCLVQTLADFDVEGKVTEVHQGPVVTRFEFRPAAGIKVSRIVGLEHDLAMAMRALSVRIMAPIPGKAAVGIEVPNKKRQGVYLKELITAPEFREQTGALAFALGKTIEGLPFFGDLAKMPHLLIAGATGAGKSVCLNTLICSILYRMPPDRVKMIMVDPKRVELSVYADIPHLLAPVVCDAKRAAGALDWAVQQMEERYKKLVELGVRNIDGYNRIVEHPEEHAAKLRGKNLQPMPYMVVIVDELADLMLVAKAEVEESIQRLAQMARAVGIHLILATQRPSVNVITGIIKANFPSRIAFQVSQKVDSRTILDANGAEALLGKGDMLFSGGGARKPIRIQGCFVSDEEVEAIAAWCRDQWAVEYEVEEFEPRLSEKEQRELAKAMGGDMFAVGADDLDAQERIIRGTNRVMGKVTAGMFVPHDGGSARAGDDEIDEALVRAAARLILESRKASVSLVQRRLKVGFARAGRLMDMLEEMGIVGEFKGSKPRDIIVDPDAALAELNRLEASLGMSATGRSPQLSPATTDDGDAADDDDVEFDEEASDDAPRGTKRRG